jgi:hypothetical protein
MTQHPNLFAALAAPFDQSEVKVRSTSGRQLHYITARTVMNRLDNVVGPENWWDRFVAGENSVLCELTIRMSDGSLLTKCDAGGYAGMADSGDDDKSGYSDAFKRAAVKFGVARYLYRDGVASFSSKLKVASCEPEAAPVPARAGNSQPATRNSNGKVRHDWPGKGPGSAGVEVKTRTQDRPPPGSDAPRNGGQLFAWMCQQQRKRGRNCRLADDVTRWGKAQGFDARVSQWTESQVSQGFEQALRMLEERS